MNPPIISHTQAIADHPNHGKRLGEPGFTYTPANKTNILETFRKMGWVPPSEAHGQSIGEAA